MRQVLTTSWQQVRGAILALLPVLVFASAASADPFTPSALFGGWAARVNGITVMSGAIGVDASGALSFGSPAAYDTSDARVTVSRISGQADPVISFAVGASNLSPADISFGFTFGIPVALSGTIVGHSALSYSLSTLGTGVVSITPAAATILTAVERDTSPGGLAVLNKGLDLGGSLSLTGPGHVDSGILVGTNVFTGDAAYDQMLVTLGFSLTPYTAVNMTGFVEQFSPRTVPEPASLFLLGGGLGAVRLASWQRKRRAHTAA